ncbi:MAG TPA: dCMP deaminase family protein [Bacillota bacterium]|nr:dCMP deaminase family protein [Bacillota bacterium]HPF42700.1 dCMP deaminase family protein [Bacillota bacterium]HPJ86319.1 dCMP deaminase family protein [Bacillota bacterium]HPQ62324.1 dCMP deaminase family protein [Bacillota bacterium]HRX92275.1 dCMP deaminase family protein [Candidatus Izemoplasmatales bacterium]
MKREDYISWDEYFMGVAMLSGLRSKDDSSQVGACIVNQKNRIVGIGYNGFPIGCEDDCFPWEREGDFLDTKYPYVVHAEANAILNTSVDLSGCRIYVTLFPCNECAKLIIQAGIREVVFLEEKNTGTDMDKAAKRLFAAANVKLSHLENFNLKVVRQ